MKAITRECLRILSQPQHPTRLPWASLVAQMGKNLPPMQGTWVQSLGWEDPLEKGMTIHSSILLGEFQGERSLAGYSPWSNKELDTIE